MDEPVFVVDLDRYNDGEDGLVGPFYSRTNAQIYIDSIADKHIREWATTRLINKP